ncbi:MAG TPA: hypothetical protein PLV92_23480, partial [Pirellulaceae bacterium]|nr:hypothetical protein [Pirellulaceae bacterium]
MASFFRLRRDRLIAGVGQFAFRRNGSITLFCNEGRFASQFRLGSRGPQRLRRGRDQAGKKDDGDRAQRTDSDAMPPDEFSGKIKAARRS